MKKVFLAIAAVCISAVASAQVLIGGNLGFGMSNSNGTNTTIIKTPSTESTTDWDGDKSSTFEIAPKIGYQLNDRMSIGFTLGYSFSNSLSVSTDPDDFDEDDWVNFYSETRVNSSAWRFAPYFRYAVAQFGKCSFFVEAALPFKWDMPVKTHTEMDYTIFGTAHHEETDVTSPTRAFSWGITVTPGFSYKMGEHCSLDLYVDVFGIAFNQKITNTYVESSYGSNENIVRNNNFYIGFNTLPESSLFRLGFNYAF